MLHLKILGEPQAKQSFRYAIRPGKDGKQFVAKYQPKKVVQNERNLAWDVKSQLAPDFKPFDCPISVTVVFVFPPPKAWPKKQLAAFKAGRVFWKDTKPDCDNLFKSLGDAMEGVVYINDSRICKKSIEKIYGEVPRTEIIVQSIYEVVPLMQEALSGDQSNFSFPVNQEP